MFKQSRAGTIFTTWLTSADRVDHAVTDDEFHDNRPEPAGVCGEVILLAPMEAPPGLRCARCVAFLAARESMRDLDERFGVHRHRRLSWLGRLLHPVTPTSDGRRDVLPPAGQHGGAA